MKHLYLLFLAALITVGFALAQSGSEDSFIPVQQIGQQQPRGISYDPHFDRIAMVDPLGQLVLADAADFQTQHVLHESGLYNAYRFSADGRWLALAIDNRVEIWDTASGTLSVDFEPNGSLRAEGPLFFSEDGLILSFNTQVRAPRELRRSENDTVNLPWLWDIAAARRERSASLPNRVRALPFFDLRNGFVYGPNGVTIAGLPERLQVQRIGERIETLGFIPSPRFEPDPITVWFSGNQIYVQPVNTHTLYQIDTVEGDFLELPLNIGHREGGFDRFSDLVFGDVSRIIGPMRDQAGVPLLAMLLGDRYRDAYQYHPLTVTLIDFLVPVTPMAESTHVLLYVFDEETETGQFILTRPDGISGMIMHPDGRHLTVRYSTRIDSFNLETGHIVQSYHPSSITNNLIAYNADGSTLLNGFEIFDTETAASLYDNPHFNNGFDQVYFASDSESVITIDGDDWRKWDIDSGSVIRHEKLILRASIIDRTDDAHRFLTNLDGFGAEIAEVGMDDRRTVYFEMLPDRVIENVFPSPDWMHYLVVYSGNAVTLYSIDQGKLWFITGDDLPDTGARRYGWIDNQTAYAYGERGSGATERIYGVEYDGSGLPTCLIDAFPQHYDQWLGIWEYYRETHAPDTFTRLALRLCDSLPGTEQTVYDILSPTPRPTRAPITATPSGIAGVPACLTNRFPDQAQEYAAIWRDLIAGMEPERVDELETLVCEGLSGEGSISEEVREILTGVQVMTIDVESGRRAFGGFIPPRETTLGLAYSLVVDEFQLQFGRAPEPGILSPDGRYLIDRTNAGHLVIYRLNKPYTTIVSEATATAAGDQPEQVRRIALRPTVTQGFEVAGPPRPTLTPTVTPTDIPRPQATMAQSDYGVVEDFCDRDAVLFTLDNPPADFAAAGTLLVRHNLIDTPPLVGRLAVETGVLTLDENLPNCDNLGCTYSFDRRWILYPLDSLVLSQPDGSNRRELFPGGQYWPNRADWIGLDTLEYDVLEYVPERSMDPIRFIERLDPKTGEVVATFEPDPLRLRINNLETNIVSTQPGLESRFAVVVTNFKTGNSPGSKFYIYDRQSETTSLFAQFTDQRGMDFRWHPLGDTLYYRYPDSTDWYQFDTSTQTHHFLGNLPDGRWSRDGRMLVSLVQLDEEELAYRLEAEEPLPVLQVWDRETGLTRRYCLPDIDIPPWPLMWSPDNRYLAFQAELEVNAPFSHTLLLDTETGSVTQISTEVARISDWMETD